jgi:sortase A
MAGLARRIEVLCWAAAIACGLYSGYAWAQARVTAAAANRLSATAVAAAGPASSAGAAGTASASGSVEQSILGRLSIPALGLSVPILEDDDTASLLRGVGHIRGTAMPGGLGTVALAGHRDTFLRPLQGISSKMLISVSQGADAYRYSVDSTEIVHPEDVRVLDTEDTPELVLITCYPFHYIGAAPLRFIVRAHLVSVAPSSLPGTR